MEHLAECGQHSTFVIPNYNSHACCYYCAKTTPSMLILYHGGFGLIHRSISFTANLEGQTFATWDSLINDLAFWIIILAVCLVFPCRTWFWLNKMLQAKVITSSRISLLKNFLKDYRTQSWCLSMNELRIKNCLYEEKIWDEKNRVTERERREKRENDFLFFLNTINWDYNCIYNTIA